MSVAPTISCTLTDKNGFCGKRSSEAQLSYDARNCISFVRRFHMDCRRGCDRCELIGGGEFCGVDIAGAVFQPCDSS